VTYGYERVLEPDVDKAQRGATRAHIGTARWPHPSAVELRRQGPRARPYPALAETLNVDLTCRRGQTNGDADKAFHHFDTSNTRDSLCRPGFPALRG
jgi:hypothetical protein